MSLSWNHIIVLNEEEEVGLDCLVGMWKEEGIVVRTNKAFILKGTAEENIG